MTERRHLLAPPPEKAPSVELTVEGRNLSVNKQMINLVTGYVP